MYLIGFSVEISRLSDGRQALQRSTGNTPLERQLQPRCNLKFKRVCQLRLLYPYVKAKLRYLEPARDLLIKGGVLVRRGGVVVS